MLRENNSITVFAKGSKEHEEAGLADDVVLIRAWTYKPRPDVAERRQREEAKRTKEK